MAKKIITQYCTEIRPHMLHGFVCKNPHSPDQRDLKQCKSLALII